MPFANESNIHTLITTKNGEFSTEPIKLSAFSDEESLAYLKHFFPYETIESQIKLAEHYAGCPVSLALAVDYIKRHPAMTINGYLRKYNTEVKSASALDDELPCIYITQGNRSQGRSSSIGSQKEHFKENLRLLVNVRSVLLYVLL